MRDKLKKRITDRRYKRKKYKESEEVRRSCIQKAREYEQKIKEDPVKKRRLFLSKKIWNIRHKIEQRLEKVRLLERQLLTYTKELETIKNGIATHQQNQTSRLRPNSRLFSENAQPPGCRTD